MFDFVFFLIDARPAQNSTSKSYLPAWAKGFYGTKGGHSATGIV
jgi:hypothetical protein